MAKDYLGGDQRKVDESKKAEAMPAGSALVSGSPLSPIPLFMPRANMYSTHCVTIYAFLPAALDEGDIEILKTYVRGSIHSSQP
jgi:hypothetical protein